MQPKIYNAPKIYHLRGTSPSWSPFHTGRCGEAQWRNTSLATVNNDAYCPSGHQFRHHALYTPERGDCQLVNPVSGLCFLPFSKLHGCPIPTLQLSERKLVALLCCKGSCSNHDKGDGFQRAVLSKPHVVHGKACKSSVSRGCDKLHGLR